MRASGIPSHERSFRTTGVDSGGKKHVLSPFEIAVPGSAEKVAMVECVRENGDDSFYFREVYPKERIVLHFTAGYLKGDLDTLTKPGYEVSVPFVVARDGTIYNLWTSKYWSYHLGKGAQGGNELMSRSSVGIELSNIGYLQKKPAGLVTQYSSTDVYCTEDEAAYYRKGPPYRVQTYFATFTDAQYASVVRLLRFLTARYAIPRKFLGAHERYDVVGAVDAFRGITSHVNYRPSGKWDIGPAFDWDRVVAGVRAPVLADA
jgi:N-acetylmuramoyl-L-alanine amidase